MSLRYYEDPDGLWTSQTDPKTKKDYGVCISSGKTLWDIPQNKWNAGRDTVTNRRYFYNICTQESSWACPSFSLVDGLTSNGETEWVYDGWDGVKRNAGEQIPIYNPARQSCFWWDAEYGTIEEVKPSDALHSLPNQSPMSAPQVEEEEIDEEIKKLQSRINKMKVSNQEIKVVAQQLERTAEQRLEQLRALANTKKLKGVTGEIKNRTGRHMESAIPAAPVLVTGIQKKTRANPGLAASFLRSVPLFHSLEETKFALLQGNLQVMDFTDGQVICKEGSPGDLFYLVYHGQVRVYEHPNQANMDELVRRNTSINRTDKEAAELANALEADRDILDEDTKQYGVMINELKAGDYFGERALLNGTSRTATVLAVGDVSCFVLDKEIFSSVVTKELIDGESSALSHSNEEVSSLARHIKNYEALLAMRARARTPTEKKIAEALLALVGAFSPELGVSDTIERMLKTLYQVFDVDRISLFFVDWPKEELLLQISRDSDIREIRLPMGKGFVGACARSAKIVNVPDVTKDSRFNSDMDKKSGFTTRCVLCCPILDGEEKATAVLQLVNKKGNQSIFSNDDEMVLNAVAEQMALTLAHKQLELASESSRHKTIPLYEIEDPLKVQIKRFYNNALSQNVPSEPVVIVETSIYHAGILLCTTSKVAVKAQTVTPILSATFKNDVSELDIKVLNLPRAARIIFNVSFAAVDDKGQVLPQLIPGQPIGWGGSMLFNFDQYLRSGHIRIKLFPGRCTPEKAAVATILSNTTKKDVDILDVEIPRFAKPVVYADNAKLTAESRSNKMEGSKEKKEVSHVVKLMIEELHRFISKDPLYKLSGDDKLIIIQARETLKSDPTALPKYLQSVPWNSAKDIQEAYRILYQWASPGPVDALTLLDHTTPDPKVRALAVSLLEGLTDDELVLYLLQLTQVLKFEPFIDSALARFVLRRALKSPKTVGQTLYWLFKAEMHVPEVRERFTCLHRLFQRHCGEQNREATGHQEYVLRRLQEVAMKIKSVPKVDRNEKVKKMLAGIVFPDHFQLPIKPELAFKGLNMEKCRVMSSKKVPLWLNFISATPNTPPLTVLFKQGDDLRQDQLTLQVLRVIDLLLKTDDLDLMMSCYGCISTGFEQGLIEVVPDSETIGGITAGKSVHLKKIRAMANVYDERRLKKWLKSKGHPQKDWEQNFMKSAAAYCVATYILGIGDRHNDNIMMTSTGVFFHIDFGHFLGNFKKKLGMKRERAPFVFTPAMAHVLGGTSSKLFKEFESLCCRAYNVLRKHSNLLITLFSLMLSCGIPELETDTDIVWLRDKLLIGVSDEEASKHFVSKIHEALTTRTTQLNDAVHMLVHA